MFNTQTNKENTMTETLYQRLGGAERIAAVVDDALDRHAVNPLLAPRFRGKDLPRLKELGTQFFCAGSGGPQKYEGRDMRTAHTGMNVNEQELIAAIDDFVAALQAQGIGQTEVNEVVAILYSFKGDILRT
jgi:hemoglobin